MLTIPCEKSFLGQYFYEKLRPLIKFWIDENGQKLFAQNDLVKKLSRAKEKAKIQNKYNLDQCCYWGKQLLKIMKEACNNQLDKAQKSGIASKDEGQENANPQAEQGTEKPKKFEKSKKARKNKKKNWKKRQE